LHFVIDEAGAVFDQVFSLCRVREDFLHGWHTCLLVPPWVGCKIWQGVADS
jgi:hypothetical protein